MSVPTYAIAVDEDQRAYGTILYTSASDVCAIPPGHSLLAETWLRDYADANKLSGDADVLKDLGVTDARTN